MLHIHLHIAIIATPKAMPSLTLVSYELSKLPASLAGSHLSFPKCAPLASEDSQGSTATLRLCHTCGL